jgi:hypothetical protein
MSLSSRASCFFPDRLGSGDKRRRPDGTEIRPRDSLESTRKVSPSDKLGGARTRRQEPSEGPPFFIELGGWQLQPAICRDETTVYKVNWSLQFGGQFSPAIHHVQISLYQIRIPHRNVNSGTIPVPVLQLPQEFQSYAVPNIPRTPISEFA